MIKIISAAIVIKWAMLVLYMIIVLIILLLLLRKNLFTKLEKEIKRFHCTSLGSNLYSRVLILNYFLKRPFKLWFNHASFLSKSYSSRERSVYARKQPIYVLSDELIEIVLEGLNFNKFRIILKIQVLFCDFLMLTFVLKTHKNQCDAIEDFKELRRVLYQVPYK